MGTNGLDQLVSTVMGVQMLLERPFVFGEANAALPRSLDEIRALKRLVVLSGSAGSGKTTYMRKMTPMRQQHSEIDLFCSSVEIHAALFIRENEEFLERLATTEVVFIDDIEQLIKFEHGKDILTLLLAERAKRHMATVISTSAPVSDLASLFPGIDLDNAVIFRMVPVASKADCIELLRSLVGYYSVPSSPKIHEETLDFVVENFEKLEEQELFIRFLVTSAGYTSEDTVTVQMARAML